MSASPKVGDIVCDKGDVPAPLARRSIYWDDLSVVTEVTPTRVEGRRLTNPLAPTHYTPKEVHVLTDSELRASYRGEHERINTRAENEIGQLNELYFRLSRKQ